MVEICGDNRFELIEKYKTKLIEATNIETVKDEIAVIDSILFRFWQMGWLDKLEADVVPKSEVERLRFNLEAVLEEIPETKREVAREIFEDIRKTCGYSVAEHDGVVLYHTKCYSIMATKLDELEKKFVPDTNVGHKTEIES